MSLGKRRYNNCLLYLKVKFFNNQLQLLVKLRMHAFLTTNITNWNFSVVMLRLNIGRVDLSEQPASSSSPSTPEERTLRIQ